MSVLLVGASLRFARLNYDSLPCWCLDAQLPRVMLVPRTQAGLGLGNAAGIAESRDQFFWWPAEVGVATIRFQKIGSRSRSTTQVSHGRYPTVVSTCWWPWRNDALRRPLLTDHHWFQEFGAMSQQVRRMDRVQMGLA